MAAVGIGATVVASNPHRGEATVASITLAPTRADNADVNHDASRYHERYATTKAPYAEVRCGPTECSKASCRTSEQANATAWASNHFATIFSRAIDN